MTQAKNKKCQNCQNSFVIDAADFDFYEKIDVPAPTFCPECRIQRRFALKNQRNIYKRKCDFSDQPIYSAFHHKASVKVYCSKAWNSNEWNPMDYGREYNSNKPFFEQFGDLRRDVPYSSRNVEQMINSDYCLNANNLKNCYLLFWASYGEDSAYGTEIAYFKDCYDNAYLTKVELCYDEFMSSGCYETFYSSECTDCQGVYFSHNCRNCHNCFGCVNLKHKKYHIFNESYKKEEYFKKITEFDLGSYQNVLQMTRKVNNFKRQFPVKFMHGAKNVDVAGDYIYACKDIKNSYLIDDSEDLKYCQFIAFRPGAKSSYDYSAWGENASLIYDSICVGTQVNNMKFCEDCDYNCHSLEYCSECHSASSNLFGCVGLRHKQYCILNKQYTKQDYEELVPKIKQHMNDMPYTDKKGRIYKYGEFFPAELSPFAYNETIAQEYFPLTKEQALKQGFTWRDKAKPEYQATLQAQDLPDHIKDTDKSILKQVIQCQNAGHSEQSEESVSRSFANAQDDNVCQSSGVFKLIPAEYDFYQKHNIPIPRLCPDCRHQERIKQRNPMKLHHRKCMCAGHKDDSGKYVNVQPHHHKDKHCPNEFETTYAPDRPEIVYCESCYQKEVE